MNTRKQNISSTVLHATTASLTVDFRIVVVAMEVQIAETVVNPNVRAVYFNTQRGFL